jgi:uncharacterized membrane protein
LLRRGDSQVPLSLGLSEERLLNGGRTTLRSSPSPTIGTGAGTAIRGGTLRARASVIGAAGATRAAAGRRIGDDSPGAVLELKVPRRAREGRERGLDTLPATVDRVVVAQVLGQRLQIGGITAAHVGAELMAGGPLGDDLGDADRDGDDQQKRQDEAGP